MGIRKYKPTTPAVVARACRLRRDHPVIAGESLRPLPKKGGRNNLARSRPATRRRAQAGIPPDDFRRADKDGSGLVAHTSTTPPTAYRAAALRGRREAPHHRAEQAKQGDPIETAPAPTSPGNNLPMRNIPVGTVIHAVEPPVAARRSPARRARSSWRPRRPYAQLRMPSGEIRNVDLRRATIGEVGNAEQSNINRAGRRMRWKGSARPSAAWP